MKSQLDSNIVTANSELEDTYLTFFSFNKLYGINISKVVQIISYQPIISIPEFPEYAVGVINLRGDVIPIIDFAMLFGEEQKEYNERTCIIVTKIRQGYIGFIVDAMDEVVKITSEYISDPPKVIGNIPGAYLMGISKKNNKKSLLLNIEKVILEDDMSVISKEVRQWQKQK